MSITVGLWGIPLVISAVAFGWAIFTPSEPSNGWFPDPMPLVRFAGAVIVALFVWLAWALLR